MSTAGSPELEHLPATRRPVREDMSIVIPTLGRNLLRGCLESIARSETWPAQLILVHQTHQGLNPRVGRWVDDLRGLGMDVEHIISSKRGIAAGLNQGFEQVRTPLVAGTDDDCRVEPTWLGAMAARLDAAPEQIVTGRVEPAGEGVVIAIVTTGTSATYRRPRVRHDTFSGGNMGAAIQVIRRVGPFDEDPCLAYAWDCEYGYRALRRGVPITYAPEVVVRHLAWRDQEQRAAQYDGYARSLAGFYGKYLRQGDGFLALRAISSVLRSMRRWAKGSVRGDRELARHGAAHVRGFLPGLIAGWRAGDEA